MKKIQTLLTRSLSIVAPMALALAVFTANSTCFFFTHQPDVPNALSRYRKYSDE